jgi:hypothetical protein
MDLGVYARCAAQAATLPMAKKKKTMLQSILDASASNTLEEHP